MIWHRLEEKRRRRRKEERGSNVFLAACTCASFCTYLAAERMLARRSSVLLVQVCGEKGRKNIEGMVRKKGHPAAQHTRTHTNVRTCTHTHTHAHTQAYSMFFARAAAALAAAG